MENTEEAALIKYSNFRNVKIGGIGSKILYRSCHPAWWDRCDYYVQRFAERANIRTIINLEDSEDNLKERIKENTWYDKKYREGRIIPLKMGLNYLEQEYFDKLKLGLRIIINLGGPYLIHCASGKDRTGIFCAFLCALMDGTIDEIKSDYMLSYINYYDYKESDASYQESGKVIDKIFETITPGSNENILVKTEYYFKQNIGLTPEEINGLKLKLSGKMCKQ
jgi:protein tyrosine/serine phosphatase